MGIFTKGSSVDPNGSLQSRNRRNSASSVSTSVPVSIVPAPPQGSAAYMKTGGNGSISGSSVFGRQQSWSDQLADSSLLNNNGGASSKVTTPSTTTTNSAAYPVYSSAGANVSNDVKFVHSTMEILENQIKREEAPKKKRTRTSTEQLRILQKAFQTDPMPNSSARMALSKKLGMSTRAVQVWFQNRRAKEKLDAKRNMMGLSGSSSFTYVKGDSDEEDYGDGAGFDEDDEFNFDEEGSVTTETTSVTGKPGGELFNSMKATGMMGRMAFNSSLDVPIKSQRSCSTPNGFFQGVSHGNRMMGIGGMKPSFSSTTSTSNTSNTTASTGACSYNHHSFSHLFPGETFISDVNEASVDQLYQDLSGAGGVGIPSPIDDLSGSAGLLSIQTSSTNSTYPISLLTASGSFFTFGDPFYGGGIVDRTPSVSPVGFGPRSLFYHNHNNVIGSSSSSSASSSFDFILPSTLNDYQNNSTINTANTMNTVNNSDNPISTLNANTVVNVNACKGISGGNVYLTSSIGSNYPNSSSVRRSFSLPEAHGNLTFLQMQQLENFGLQVFPSPLLSINEESTSANDNNTSDNNKTEVKDKIIAPSSPNSSGNQNDFLIPFSDFLEGEVIR